MAMKVRAICLVVRPALYERLVSRPGFQTSNCLDSHQVRFAGRIRVQGSVMECRVSIVEAFYILGEWFLVVVEDRELPRFSWEGYLAELCRFWLWVRWSLFRDGPVSHGRNESETM